MSFSPAGLAAQLTEVKERGERAIRQDIAARRHQLSERQSGMLTHALERGKLTIGDLEGLYPGAAKRTLQRDLKHLVALAGLLLRQGGTNRVEYLPLDRVI